MKKFLLLSLSAFAALSIFTAANVFASGNGDFHINNAYFKGDGKYDVVVYSPTRDTLQIYVNDENPVRTKVNKEGWATFKKVKLTGQSKLSFAKRTGWFQYWPVDYVQYISVDGDQVALTDTGPKHSFDDFFKWSTSERYDAMMAPVGSAYQQIMASCNSRDRDFGSEWTACMQEGYKEYLKPDTFIGDNWTGDYTTMVAHINSAITQKNLYGDLSISESEQYKTDMQEAQKIYQRLAITN